LFHLLLLLQLLTLSTKPRYGGSAGNAAGTDMKRRHNTLRIAGCVARHKVEQSSKQALHQQFADTVDSSWFCLCSEVAKCEFA
jgi:hypothetical protein